MICPDCSAENAPAPSSATSAERADRRLPELRRDEQAGRQVLQRVRHGAGGRRRRPRSRGRTAAPAPRGDPVAERRLVTVLFADLVGFTPFAEERDAEEVRDMLTRYFDLAREIIGRYGGTVEKFIGDAVMAVWGAPIAHEDDAERAVRAALELVDAVRADRVRRPGAGRAC